jgi:hypothetical protein
MGEMKTLDQIKHDHDEAGQLQDFATTSLRCGDKESETLARTLRHKFRWSGVRLLFLGETHRAERGGY